MSDLSRRDAAKRIVRFGALLAAGGLAIMRQPYEHRWNEIEAWRLAEHRPPQPFP